MFAICFWHLLVHGFDIKNIGTHPIENNLYLIICSILVPSVNCFMLLSGYYEIKFNIKKIFTFVIQASFYFWLCLLLKIIIWNDFAISNLIHIFPISTKSWWFLTEYFIIMILSPIINEGVNKICKKQFIFILVTLIFINSFGLYLNRSSLGSNFLSLLILYLIGRFFSIYEIYLKPKQSIILWIGSTTILSILVYILSEFYPKISWWLLSYNNPLIILQAIGILYCTLSIPEKHYKPFIVLGSHSFAIYLFTEGIGINLYHFWANIFVKSSIYAIIYIIITCLVCILIDMIQSKINYTIRNITRINSYELK